MNTNTGTRSFGLDLLRIISMIMIPILHILDAGGILANAGSLSSDYDTIWFLEILCYGAVDCFGLISGYAGYGKKIKYTNLVLLWLRVVLYSAVITLIFKCINPSEVGLTEIMDSFIPTLTRKYWYFTVYAGMFLFLPFVNKGLEIFSKKDLYVICIIFILLFSVFTTFTEYTSPFSLTSGYSVVWLLVLYIFGAVVKKYSLESTKPNWVWILFFVNGTLITWLSKVILHRNSLKIFGKTISSGFLVSYISPFVLMAAFGLFCFCANLKIKQGSIVQKIISFFSPLCFSVYLIHEHPLLKEVCITGRFAFLLQVSPALMVLLVIAFAIVIFLECSLMDLPRELLFRALKLKQRLSALEEKITCSLSNH